MVNWLHKLASGATKVCTRIFTKETGIFLMFLAIAFGMWVMHAFGTVREITMQLPIVYEGMPKNIALRNELPKHVNMVLQDDGTYLFSYYWRYKHDTVYIDLSTIKFSKNGSVNYSLDSVQRTLNEQLRTTTTMVRFEPLNIRLNYGILSQKRLPVVLQDTITTAPQYVMAGDITLEPAEIEVYGLQNALDSMNHVTLKRINKHNLNKTVHFTQPIIMQKGIKYSQTKIHVHVPVEMATEKKLTVPVEAENLVDSLTLRTFPAEVDVYCLVGMSRFNTIRNDLFRVVADCSDIHSGGQTCHVILAQQPDSIYNVRIVPDEVEFVLEHVRTK